MISTVSPRGIDEEDGDDVDEDGYGISAVEYYRMQRRRSPLFDKEGDSNGFDKAKSTERDAAIATATASVGDRTQQRSEVNRSAPPKSKRVFMRSPEILQKLPASVQLMEGDSLDLQSQIYGLPKPEVSWFREGAELREGEDGRTMFLNDVDGNSLYGLLINHISVLDAGKYTVLARNEAGQATCSTKVCVDSRTSGSILINRHRICSIPEETITETEAYSDPDPDSDSDFDFDRDTTNTAATSIASSLSLLDMEKAGNCFLTQDARKSRGADIDSGADCVEKVMAARARPDLLASQPRSSSIAMATERRSAELSRTELFNVTDLSQSSGDHAVYYCLLAANVICFTALLLTSGPSDDFFADFRRFAYLTSIFLLWCFLER